jgi:hypothetical protein
MTADERFVCHCRECGQRYRVDKRWKLRPIATCRSCGKLFRIVPIHVQRPRPSIVARIINRLSSQLAVK